MRQTYSSSLRSKDILTLAKESLQTILAFASIYVIWGSTYLAIRFAIETIPPFLMAGTRFMIAGAFLYSWARLRGASSPSRLNWRATAIVGGLLLFGGNGGVVWAEQTVPTGLVAILIATVPLWMVLIETVRPNGDRLSRGVLAGVVVGFAGVTILVGQGELTGTGSYVNALSALIVVGAAFSWALGSIYSRGAAMPSSAQLSTAMEMLAGGAVLLIASVVTNEWAGFNLAKIGFQSSLAFLYLIVFGSLVAFTAYIWLLRTTTAARASTYGYVNPIVAVFLGWALAGESVTLLTLFAAAIVIGSVVVITTYRPTTTKSSERWEKLPNKKAIMEREGEAEG